MKKLNLIVSLFFVASSAFSQSFMHGVGISFFGATAKGGSKAAPVNGGITYSPRINIVEQKNISVSIGVPFSIGLAGSVLDEYKDPYNNFYMSETQIAGLFNATLNINLNIGAGSTKKTKCRFGYFAGAGFGYHAGTYYVSAISSHEDVNTKFNAYGPAGNAGIRFGVGKGKRNIELKLSYMKGVGSNTKADVFGIGNVFNF